MIVKLRGRRLTRAAVARLDTTGVGGVDGYLGDFRKEVLQSEGLFGKENINCSSR